MEQEKTLVGFDRDTTRKMGKWLLIAHLGLFTYFVLSWLNHIEQKIDLLQIHADETQAQLQRVERCRQSTPDQRR